MQIVLCLWLRSECWCISFDVAFVGHIPVYFRGFDSICLVWNYTDILRILHKHRCVLAYLAGHTHKGTYSKDEKGVHHIVFPGVIKARPKSSPAHATILLYPDRVVIIGSQLDVIIMNASLYTWRLPLQQWWPKIGVPGRVSSREWPQDTAHHNYWHTVYWHMAASCFLPVCLSICASIRLLPNFWTW